ncbi:hypothetical protein I0C86_23365 [Plantactinospora sp. S1510]|uniref:Uncharacterized protein n=1 Tax=Plantactinospora alkalitolerans TaxID=2789879 RepID=A0ABS0H0P3_9ACTN|nr:hypothetical protein [Plantactinospora alkalitolerans]MBF9131881.1 hypothetical protein [Plantactinospora alkalitolerans]
MKFVFSRDNPDQHGTSFELGDIRVIGARGEATSAGKIPSQSMFIYLSLVDLADGMRLLTEKKESHHHFAAVNSSFTIEFHRRAAKLIEVRSAEVAIGSESLTGVVDGMLTGFETFMSDPRNVLGTQEPASTDLTTAVRELRVARERSGG